VFDLLADFVDGFAGGVQLHGDNHVRYLGLFYRMKLKFSQRKNKKAHSVRVGQSLVTNFAYNSGPRTSLGGVLKRCQYGKTAMISLVIA
jgi:hypothetical protein